MPGKAEGGRPTRHTSASCTVRAFHAHSRSFCFYAFSDGKPVSTFPENALTLGRNGVAVLRGAFKPFQKAEIAALAPVDGGKVGIDAHSLEASLDQQGSDGLCPCAIAEMHAGENAFMRLRQRGRGAVLRARVGHAKLLQQRRNTPGEPGHQPRIDKIAIDDQHLAAGLENPVPFAEGGQRIDQGPHEVAIGNHVITGIGFQRVFRIAHEKADRPSARVRLGAGALQHGLGPVHAGHGKAQIIEKMRNHGRTTGKIERTASTPLAKMTAK